ncbi:MAG: zinc finger MYND domain-containing protein [Candidatus Babeliales bacterium]|nr:zinc finger MYND domain-containing protein [Candidatus Babeliales bacterium]
MKINKLFLLLICLFNLQTSGFPIYFCKFVTPAGKEIIIIGDQHVSLGEETENKYLKIMKSFFNNQEKQNKKTKILIESSKLKENYKKEFKKLTIFGMTFGGQKDIDFLDNLNLDKHSDNDHITFKHSDIRPLEKDKTTHACWTITDIENFLQNNNYSIDFETRKREYTKLFNITLIDYYNSLCKAESFLNSLLNNYPDLSDLIKRSLMDIVLQKFKFKLLIQSKGEKLPIINLTIDKDKYCPNKLSALSFDLMTSFASFADVGFAKDILDSVETNDTTVLVAGNLHAVNMEKFLSSKFEKVAEYGIKPKEFNLKSNYDPINLNIFNKLMNSEKSCDTCFNSKNLKLCTGCRSVSYCSQECQKSDWSNHKAVCKAVKSKIEEIKNTNHDMVIYKNFALMMLLASMNFISNNINT